VTDAGLPTRDLKDTIVLLIFTNDLARFSAYAVGTVRARPPIDRRKNAITRSDFRIGFCEALAIALGVVDNGRINSIPGFSAHVADGLKASVAAAGRFVEDVLKSKARATGSGLRLRVCA
jgi:hypothetical protein